MNFFNFLHIKNIHTRSCNIQKNIALSFLLKGISIGINLLLVPLTLNYLDKERYGLWLTMSSVISWFSLFDIGLGNGFRNKFAEAITAKDTSLAKTYVSTTFALLSIIIGLVLVVFLVINPLLNWQRILNTTAETKNTLSQLAAIIFVFFSLQFVFKLTTSILLADQKSSIVDLIGVVASLLSLIIICILIRVGRRSLLYLGAVLSVCPVISLIIAFFIAFRGKYKIYSPSIRFVDLKQSKSLVGLGFLFFIPQLCSLIVFSTSNIIITQIFTPAEVAVYNIAYKYFMVVMVFSQIFINPFWSAFTESFMRGDTVWIKNAIRKLVVLWAVSCLGCVVMIAASKWVFHIWVGDQITIPLSLLIGLAVYICISNWNNIFVSFTNGVSKIFIQLCLSLFVGVVFIPLTVALSKNIGLMGVPIGMGLSILPGSFIITIQCKKLITGQAGGMWNK
jgi:O-antigen/teichoic acid export membrane protein